MRRTFRNFLAFITVAVAESLTPSIAYPQEVPQIRQAEALQVATVRRVRLDSLGSTGGLFAEPTVVRGSNRGNRVAVIRDTTSGSVVMIFRIPSGSLERRYLLEQRVANVVWDPKDERLYYARFYNGPGDVCGVLDLQTGRSVRLPRPGCISDAVSWINDSTVVSGTRQCNLNAMTCGRSNSNIASSVGTSRFVLRSFAIRSGIGRAGLFAVSLQDSSYRDLGVYNDNPQAFNLAVLPDVNIVIAGGTRSTWLIELGKVSSGPIALRLPTSDFGESAELDRLPAIMMQRAPVGGEVCPAQLNPLNNRVLGGDCRRVKARVRFEAKQDGSFLGRVRELYEPIAAGDVLVVQANAVSPPLSPRPWIELREQHFLDSLAISSAAPRAAGEILNTATKASTPEPIVPESAKDSAVTRSVQLAASPTKVWETVVAMFAQSGYKTVRSDSSARRMITERSQNLVVLELVRTYYVSVSSDPANPAGSIASFGLIYRRIAKSNRKVTLDLKDGERELQRTVSNLLANLR